MYVIVCDITEEYAALFDSLSDAWEDLTEGYERTYCTLPGNRFKQLWSEPGYICMAVREPHDVEYFVGDECSPLLDSEGEGATHLTLVSVTHYVTGEDFTGRFS